MDTFVDVIVPLPLPKLTYSVPEEGYCGIVVGNAVLVPLRGKLLWGIVVKKHTNAPKIPVKPLLAWVDAMLMVSRQQLELIHWLADYYLLPIGSALDLAWPRLLSVTGMRLRRHPHVNKQITEAAEAYVWSRLTAKVTYRDFIKSLGKPVAYKAVTALLHKQCIQVEWPYSPPIPSSFCFTSVALPKLAYAMQKASDELSKQWEAKQVILLQGSHDFTGLYMRCIQQKLTENKQVLLLVPDIFEAKAMEKQMQPFFGPHLVSYHAKQSPKATQFSWITVKYTTPTVVIGTRSALFLPFHKLALVIVHQEEEAGYKQTIGVAPYHARNVALQLAISHEAKVLLSAATPTVETYYHATSGQYGKVLVHASAPSACTFHVVDLNKTYKQRKMRDFWAKEMEDALQKNQMEGKQALVFQNRRGYAHYCMCKACGWVARCPNCAVSLTYHQEKNRLVCHYCAYSVLPYSACLDCGAANLHHIGSGTEKLVESLQALFAHQKIFRIDLDSIPTQKIQNKIRSQLAAQEIDILVGTQMVTKFLQEARISWIGLLDVDGLLHFPDFRSNERCFARIRQLVHQAGCRNHPVDLWVQTRQPSHPLFAWLAHDDYEGMYTHELVERKNFGYPPYVHLMQIRLSGSNPKRLALGAHALKQSLLSQTEADVLGPQEPVVAKIKQLFLLDLWIKMDPTEAKNWGQTKKKIYALTQKFLATYKACRIAFDVNP